MQRPVPVEHRNASGTNFAAAADLTRGFMTGVVSEVTNRSDKKKGVFSNVQALRGLAAMLVVLFHANFAAVEYGVWDRTYFYFGGCGPDIFFAISGFIMVVSTRPMWGNRYWWRVFIRRRIVRIVPMYWLFTDDRSRQAPQRILHRTTFQNSRSNLLATGARAVHSPDLSME